MVRAVRSRKHWDVRCPAAKKHVVAGKLVPTVRGAFTFRLKKRRLVIEIQGDDETEKDTAASPHVPQFVADIKPKDYVTIRILKPRTHWGLSRDYEDTDDEDDASEDPHKEENGWVEYRKYDLDDIDEDCHVHDNSFETKFGRGSSLEVREVKFASKSAVQEFSSELSRLRRLLRERGQKDIETYRNKTSPGHKPTGGPPLQVMSSEIVDEDVNLLVEIVSATDLPKTDIISTDPYVVVWMGKTEVHRTSVIKNSCDPIWTVDNGSLFILSITSTDFFQSTAGLTFLLKDYDTVGANDAIGKVNISQNELLACEGERVEYKIDMLLPSFDAKKVVFPPKLNIRVRPASREDFKFIKTLHAIQRKKRLGVYASESFVAPLPHTVNRVKRETKHSSAGDRHRVKPGPDPDREEQETKWLTKKQINEEHMKPSTKWIETGSGTLGRLYVEILRCDGLPNMDTGALGDKTDAFCCIIYEDAIVNTDVINDELSPRWMPWSQRAFIFHIQHPSSQILVGVFDYDNLANDPIGRVSIDVTNFNSNTDYILTYTLYESVLDEVREPRGTLTVRLRLEVGNFRKLVVASFRPPPVNLLNVAKKEDFRSARFVTQGEENLSILDMDALKSYGNELQSYADVVLYIQQALITVLLWRGHHQVSIFGFKFKLALHSMVAFVMGVTLAENFDLFPSYFFLSIAWVFLATNEQRQENPSPWHHTATFWSFWFALITGRSATNEIAPNDPELLPLVQEYEAKLDTLRKKHKEREESRKKETGLMDTYFAQAEIQTAEQDGTEEIETNTGRYQLNPLKPVLLPIQKILGRICETIRITRSIVMWDESVYAFIITNVCLLVGVALIFVPWSWIGRWLFRVFVWVILGPWMKLVDVFVVRRLQADDDNFIKRLELSIEQRSKLLLLKKRTIMTMKEDSLKLGAMKRYMFGRYLARVPRFKQYRYPDVPLAESTAFPHDPGCSSVTIVARKHGQQLVGHMIPAWGDAEGRALLTSTATGSDKRQGISLPTILFKSKDKAK